MEGLDYWRLCDELNVIQAALLVVGHDPSSDANYVEGWEPKNRPAGYEATKAALSNALRKGTIEGAWVQERERDYEGNFGNEIEGSVDLRESLINVHSLRSWLATSGINNGFFFPDGGSAPGYLFSLHPRYAPKLATAVKAWLAVEHEALSGRSAKQILVKWLRQHAAELGFSDEEGKPNEFAIEEIAKVANWQLGGGAPKTPTI